MVLLFGVIFIASCHSSKNISYKSSEYREIENLTKKSTKSKNTNTHSVIKEAYKFLGTPYKYGGTTKSGMDCSGLVINAFQSIGLDRKSTRLNSSHVAISYAVFCLKKKK